MTCFYDTSFHSQVVQVMTCFYDTSFYSQVVQVMTWFRDTSYDDLIPPNATMTSLPVMRSKLECSRTCLTRVSCNSFFYNDVSKTCAPQWLVFVSPENVTLESGWRYYRLTTGDQLFCRIFLTCILFDITCIAP